jgi:hypothetical protein
MGMDIRHCLWERSWAEMIMVRKKKGLGLRGTLHRMTDSHSVVPTCFLLLVCAINIISIKDCKIMIEINFNLMSAGNLEVCLTYKKKNKMILG